MFGDIAIPNNNEVKFIEIALRLGIKKLYFLYDFENNQRKIPEKLGLIKNYNKINLEIGLIVNQKNMNKALQQSKLLAAESSDRDRFFIESNKIKLIYGFEEIYKKDYLHQRASGLNHVMCELANKNDVVVGLPYSALFNKNPAVVSLLIGRIMQNISLCQKHNAKTIIGSFSSNPFELRPPYDIISLFTTLGMNSKTIRESLAFSL